MALYLYKYLANILNQKHGNIAGYFSQCVLYKDQLKWKSMKSEKLITKNKG